MFNGCNSLISLPDISKWNTSNVIDMSGMFSECNSIISLPNISKWNTSNVENMSYMFNGCKQLKLLPDISKWNINNTNNMNYMFNECDSLVSIADLSKWNIDKINNMSLGCPSLLSNFEKLNDNNLKRKNSNYMLDDNIKNNISSEYQELINEKNENNDKPINDDYIETYESYMNRDKNNLDEDDDYSDLLDY